MATQIRPSAPPETPEFRPYVPPEQSPAELTARAVILGAVLGIVFAASSVYLALKIGLTVSASIPIAVLAVAFFRTLGKSTILENNIVQTTGSAGESIAAGVVFTLPAILLMGYDLNVSKVAVIAVIGGLLGILMMIPLRRALIVKEHGNLTYPEGTACAEVLIAGDKGGLQARLLFQAFGIAFVYKFLMAGLKLWKEYPGRVSSFYKNASISAEVSPELLGVGYIIGPRIAGYLFAGGSLAYLVLIPAITLFGSGLTQPIFAETKLIRDMSPSEVRAEFVFYIGAGAVASAGIIALFRALPTIVGAFRSGFQDLQRSAGELSSRLRTDIDLPIWVTIAGSIALVLVLTLGSPGRRQPAGSRPDHHLRLLLRGGLLPHHRRNRRQRQPDLGHDHRRPDRYGDDLLSDRLDRSGLPGRGDLDRGRDRRIGRPRGHHQPGSQDRISGWGHPEAAADRDHGRGHDLRPGDRLDHLAAQYHVHQRRPRASSRGRPSGRRARAAWTDRSRAWASGCGTKAANGKSCG